MAAAIAAPSLQVQNQIKRPQGLVASSASGSPKMGLPFLQQQMQILSSNIAAAAAAAASAMKLPLGDKLSPGAAAATAGADVPPTTLHPALERQKQIQGAAAGTGGNDGDSDVLNKDAGSGPMRRRPSVSGSDSGSVPDPAAARAAAAAAAAAEEAAQLEPDAPLATDLGPLLFGRPIGMPRLDRTFNPQHIGPNFLFFSGLGYIFAVCTQSYNIQVGSMLYRCV
jgi:hypothetical protein